VPRPNIEINKKKISTSGLWNLTPRRHLSAFDFYIIEDFQIALVWYKPTNVIT